MILPNLGVMPDGYIPMRTTPSKPSADVANDPFTLTEAECELVYGSGGFLQIHCPLWKRNGIRRTKHSHPRVAHFFASVKIVHTR